MPNISDYYPPLSGCDGVGLMGGCGLDCPVLADGDCPIEEELLGPFETVDDKSAADDFDRAMDILN